MKPSGIRKFFDIANTMEDVISLGVGEPDFPTPWQIRKAGITSLENSQTRYTSNRGLEKLRAEIANYVKRKYQLTYRPEEEILITVGGSEAIDACIRAVVSPGDEVIIPQPSYVCYEPITRLAGGIPVIIETKSENAFKLTPEELLAAITPRTKALILPYPCNPTGAIMEREDLEKIAAILRDKNILVLSDEIYAELTFGGKKHVSIAEIDGMWDRTVVVNGFSKTFSMTGWRLGWAIAPKELIAEMTKMQENIVACAPLPAQYAGIEALRDDSGSAAIRDEFRRRRDVIYNGINNIKGLKCMPVPATFYALVDVSSTGLTGKEFAFKLLETEKVAVVHGSAYGGEHYDKFIRIAFTMKEERLMEALRRIEKFMSSLELK